MGPKKKAGKYEVIEILEIKIMLKNYNSYRIKWKLSNIRSYGSNKDLIGRKHNNEI